VFSIQIQKYRKGENVMAIAGLVLGILSLVGGSIPVANAFPMWLFGIVGIILSAIARKKEKSGIATAGLVLSIIGTILSFIFFLACVACVAVAGSSLLSL
jgi:hypothetical protein